jgi:hypothetical protein
MSSPLRFSDHTAFHHQVIRMAIAGAALSLLAYLVGLVIPMNGRLPQAVFLAITATALGLAAFPPQRKTLIPVTLLGLGVGLLGALAMQALAHSTPTYPWFGLGVYGLSIGVIAGRDLRGLRRLILPLATGLLVVLATWVEMTFRARLQLASYVPSFLAEPVYGAAYGFLVSVAMVVRQLHWVQDPVTKAFEKIRPTLSGEMLELSDQAVTLYIRTQQVLRDRRANGDQTEPALGQAVEKLVLRIFHIGRQWQEVERGAGRTNADELVDRLAGLDKKIEESTDDVARKQYQRAREAVSSQLRYLRDISKNRERVIARVHNYLATLERLHLALWNHRGSDAAKLSDEIQPILDEIEEIGHEMDFASAALDEVADVSEGAKEAAAAESSVDSEGEVAGELEAAGADTAETEQPAPVEPVEPVTETEPAEPATETEPAEPATETEAKDKAKDPESELSSRAFD